MYYNKLTQKTASTLTDKLLKSRIKNPKSYHFESEGWITTPIIDKLIPEGYFKIPDTRRIELIDDLPYFVYMIENEAEREIRLNQEAQEQFIQKANELSDELIDKYKDFIVFYQTTIQEAIQVNPEIPTNITYKDLIDALMVLEGEIWVKKAFALSSLWQDVVVESGLTAKEAFELLPYMAFRSK
jgi:hypothetical protein